MVPTDLRDFMLASLGASASFIGLLFVGLSVVLQRVEKNQTLVLHERLLAESSYAALVNIFFVSLAALIPHTSIGYVCIIMALAGLSSTFRLIFQGKTNPLIITSMIYLLELVLGVYIKIHSRNYVNIDILETIFITLFATALIRAWELTGIHDKK